VLPLADASKINNYQYKGLPDNVFLNGKILLVEDDFINQKIAQTLLSKTGLIVDIAENGQQAINLWQHREYHLILMDCRMPVMDGYDATKAIRELETDTHTPIIALTANGSLEDRQRCINAGMNEVITKPFKRELLIKSIAKWLSPAVPIGQHKLTGGDNTTGEVFAIDDSDRLKTVDHDLFAKLKEEMDEDFPEIFAAIVQSIEGVLQQFDDNLLQMSNDEMARLAHSIKSPATNLGAIKLSHIAEELENTADSDHLSNAGIKIEQLKQEFQAVLLELDQRIS